MSKTIIVGKSENSFFLKIVKNLTLRKKYKELFVASANSCQELFQKILSSKEEIDKLRLKPSTQIHFGFKRNTETKKLERCENLSQVDILATKEFVNEKILQNDEEFIVAEVTPLTT